MICPEIATFVHNCCIRPARLFVTGGIEISSEEGSTQGCPVAMPLYAVGVTPLLRSCKTEGVKHVAFVDDVNSAWFLVALRVWWDKVVELGPYIGYDANARFNSLPRIPPRAGGGIWEKCMAPGGEFGTPKNPRPTKNSPPQTLPGPTP